MIETISSHFKETIMIKQKKDMK